MIELYPLIPYLCHGMYTKEIHDKISKCNHKVVDEYLDYCNLMCENNSFIKEKLYIDRYINAKRTTLRVKNKYVSITIRENKMILYIYTTKSIQKIFNKPGKVLRPIYCDTTNNKHMMMLIFDNDNKQIYVYDPNNDHKIISHIEYVLDWIIYNHEFTDNYCVVPSVLWNPTNFILNSLPVKSPIYYGGHCVVSSIMIGHLYILLGKTLKEIIDILRTLTNEHLVSLLNDYSLFYYLYIH